MKYLLILLNLFIFSTYTSGQITAGVMGTKTGYLICYSSDSLNLTIRLDEPNSEMPKWLNTNRLQLLNKHFYIQITNIKNLNFDCGSPKENLYNYKNWETDYINKSLPKHVKRSAYITDNRNINIRNTTAPYNAWYYIVYVEQYELSYYFFDVYHNGSFIRFEFMGDLENARLFISAVYNNFFYYNNTLDFDKLKVSLKNGEYGYPE